MSIENTLSDRSKTHGSFVDNAAMSQALMREVRAGKNWDKLTDVQREALQMIMHKVSRLMSGDHLNLDTMHDIVGYAKLMEAACANGNTAQ